MGGDEREYRRDLSHTTWEEIFRRQSLRHDLAEGWLDRLAVGPGTHLADLGCGPGYVSLLAARRVGPTGRVLAVDRSPDALAFLRARLAEAGLTQVRPILADLSRLDLRAERVDAALLCYVLHHLEEPGEAVLRRLFAGLPAGVRLVVAEFDPGGERAFGPPLDRRLAPDDLAAWLGGAGYRVLDRWQETREQYALLVLRP